MKPQICPGGGRAVVKPSGIQPSVAVYWNPHDFQQPVKRVRMTCPRCKRRLLSSVKLCHDGCCLIHTVPPHKVRHWWKKSKKVRSE